jgi:hypothetical protein
MKKQFPIILAFTIGCVLLVRYFVPAIDFIEEYARRFLFVLGSTAGLLGILSFVVHHSTKVKRKAPRWPFSILALVAFLAMALTGFFGGGTEYGTAAYKLFRYAYAPMDATMFSLLAFFISSAAFRAFRARNLEATLLLIAAIIVMLGRVPLGELIPGMGPLQTWILDFPNTAAKRAIMIGVGFGMASTALKLMLGIERAYLGRD